MINLTGRLNGSLGRIIEGIAIAILVGGITLYGNYKILNWKVEFLEINLDKAEKVVKSLSDAVVANKIDNEKQWERLNSVEEKIKFLSRKPRDNNN